MTSNNDTYNNSIASETNPSTPLGGVEGASGASALSAPIFRLISEIADAQGVECYVIGGYVRDLFLHRPSKDIDVVVVGSGIAMAEAVAKRLGRKATLAVFKNFGTAQVKSGDVEVEFVGARRESYRHDSRKPIVEDGTLEDDQNRRDFTINALALCLNRARFGELVDPFGGMNDLENLGHHLLGRPAPHDARHTLRLATGLLPRSEHVRCHRSE